MTLALGIILGTALAFTITAWAHEIPGVTCLHDWQGQDPTIHHEGGVIFTEQPMRCTRCKKVKIQRRVTA